ncbi:ATP-dependent translocase ABCB1-like [Onthophagus taurus]|uniref:ATP-dependent translocase ABCB1-like n=1 Tax=Onthophagus taurus TaxID=166361 RepID=UPI000C20DBB7|nr:multidrug resistance protein 1-like [Onthophagus taurus]
MKRKFTLKHDFSSVESFKSNGIIESFQEPVEEEPKEEKNISIFQLYRYATCLDLIFIFLGIIGAGVSGACIPVMMMLFSDVTGGIITYATNIIVDANNTQFYNEALTETIRTFTINSCILAIVSLVCVYSSVALFSYSALRQTEAIRCLYMKHVLNQDISWYDTHSTGDFASRIAEDLAKIEEGLGDKSSTLIFYMAAFISGIIMAFIKGWELSLICLIYFPVSLVGMQIVSWLTTKFVRNEMEAYASAGCIAEEVLSAIRTVVAFGGQTKECERYREQLVIAKDNNIKKSLLTAINNGIMWFLVFGSYSLSFYYGVDLIIDERHLPEDEKVYTSANMLTVFFSILLATWNFGQCAPYFQIFSVACGAATKIYSVIDEEPIINASKGHGRRLPNLKGNIVFKDVKFNYPSRKDVQILRDTNFKINAGETVALVGSSGCGKSTCIQLIQRFYDPIFGNITIDGVDLRDFDLRWLRSHIGVVGQEPALFATTIAENIKLGNPKATENDIERAAMKANAHSFIMKLPQGYDTLVGERGAQLSGGQKQRIAIARALIRDPSILLLDEATSALDTHSEYQVQKTIDSASKECTTIIVAHRLSTVRNANRILVFSNGKVVEEGNHQELMAKEGVYYELVNAQTSDSCELDENISKRSENEEDKEEIDEDDFLDDVTETIEDEEESDKKQSYSPIWMILTLNSPEAIHIILGCICAMIFGASLPAYSFVFGDIVGVLSDPNDDYVKTEGNKFSLYFLIIGIVSGFTSFLQWYLFGIAGEKLTNRVRGLLFEKILNQEMGWFDRKENGVGAICAKLSSDASSVQGAAGQPIGTVLNSLSTMSIAVGVSFYYEWRLTLVTLAVVPLIFFGIYLEQKVLRKDSGSSDPLIQSTKVAVEAIGNIRTVCSLGCEHILYKRYRSILEPHYNKARIHLHGTAMIFAFARALMFICYSISIYYGGRLITQNELPYENLFKISEALISGAWSVGNAVAFTPNLQKGISAAASITRILRRVPNILDHEKSSSYGWGNGNVRYSKVSFKYPTRKNVTVLSDLDLMIFQGKTVGLVGPSGCGKSTIIQMIQRFYDPICGAINVDRTNILNLKLSSLRSHLGIVSQEPNLFDRTIAENIAYGDNQRNVTKQEIIEAAKKANIHNFITSLPLGYDTRVGEKGTQMSGGQKQRIAIARALIRNPQVLVLDEATSALDSESEKVVQEALENARQGRTCITIAHRLTTLQNADLICVLNKGQVEEMGTHNDLINCKGIYYKLYTMQVHG